MNKCLAAVVHNNNIIRHSERRKKAGKERGLPENLRKAIAKRKKRPKNRSAAKKK